MLRFIVKASGETEFLMRYPEEWADYTLERERGILRDCCNDENRAMIACIVDGRIVGNCQIVFRTGMKESHRASVAVAILQEFWGLGIATRLFEEMLQLARDRGGIQQLLVETISQPDLPIVFNLNVGHALPRCIIPFGVEATVDAEKQSIRFADQQTGYRTTPSFAFA